MSRRRVAGELDRTGFRVRKERGGPGNRSSLLVACSQKRPRCRGDPARLHFVGTCSDPRANVTVCAFWFARRRRVLRLAGAGHPCPAPLVRICSRLRADCTVSAFNLCLTPRPAARWSRASLPGSRNPDVLTPSRECHRCPRFRFAHRRRVLRLAQGCRIRSSTPASCRLPLWRSGRWLGLFFAALRAAGDCAASAASCRLPPVRDGAIGSRASLPGSLPIGQGTARARM